MAATEITVQAASINGLEATYAGANADGNFFKNDGKTFLHVKNDGVADIVVTVASPTKCNQGHTHDETTTITAGEARIIGPFPPSRFSSSGQVSVSYDDVTDLTVAAVQVA